eukprot:gene1062-632_t
MPQCIECGHFMEEAIHPETRTVNRCPNCDKVCDTYYEFDEVQKWIDVALLRRRAWAHILFNERSIFLKSIYVELPLRVSSLHLVRIIKGPYFHMMNYTATLPRLIFYAIQEFVLLSVAAAWMGNILRSRSGNPLRRWIFAVSLAVSSKFSYCIFLTWVTPTHLLPIVDGIFFLWLTRAFRILLSISTLCFGMGTATFLSLKDLAAANYLCILYGMVKGIVCYAVPSSTLDISDKQVIIKTTVGWSNIRAIKKVENRMGKARQSLKTKTYTMGIGKMVYFVGRVSISTQMVLSIKERHWEDGMFNGQGTYTYKDGSVYEGSWLKGLQNGHGTYTSATGKGKYTGEWGNGEPHGRGRLEKSNGSYYDGDWKNGLQNGKGMAKYDDLQTEYHGDWKNGKESGGGHLKYQNVSKAVKFDEGGIVDEEVCFHCLERHATTIFVPCGHVRLCQRCASEEEEEKKKMGQCISVDKLQRCMFICSDPIIRVQNGFWQGGGETKHKVIPIEVRRHTLVECPSTETIHLNTCLKIVYELVPLVWASLLAYQEVSGIIIGLHNASLVDLVEIKGQLVEAKGGTLESVLEIVDRSLLDLGWSNCKEHYYNDNEDNVPQTTLLVNNYKGQSFFVKLSRSSIPSATPLYDVHYHLQTDSLITNDNHYFMIHLTGSKIDAVDVQQSSIPSSITKEMRDCLEKSEFFDAKKIFCDTFLTRN